MTRLEAAEQYIRYRDTARELAQAGRPIPTVLSSGLADAEFMYDLLSAAPAVPAQRERSLDEILDSAGAFR